MILVTAINSQYNAVDENMLGTMRGYSNDEIKKLQLILISSYEFKRRYDTRGTKRYNLTLK